MEVFSEWELWVFSTRDHKNVFQNRVKKTGNEEKALDERGLSGSLLHR